MKQNAGQPRGSTRQAGFENIRGRG